MFVSRKRIAILGGGLQGTCLALELTGRGAVVDLYERNDTCLSEASENNEGKIHLGFVYANDRSFATAICMAEGALSFETALRRWLGDDVDRIPTSRPFVYAVHHNSLIEPDAFETYARRVCGHIAEISGGRTYFGADAMRPAERLSNGIREDMFQNGDVVAAYETGEIAIDPVALTGLLRARLSCERNVSCLTGHVVDGVSLAGDGAEIRFSHAGGCETRTYDHVVNTLWSSRLPIDMQIGLEPALPWSHRLKYFVRGTAGTDRPFTSTTFVVGPFGDLVDYGNGNVYLSWYPAGLVEWSNAPAAPNRPLRMANGDGTAIRTAILKGLGGIVRGVAEIDPEALEVRGGWIFAWGETDIDDPVSLLHQRHQIGIRVHGPYMTIDTGKLTMAPLYALKAADLLCQ